MLAELVEVAILFLLAAGAICDIRSFTIPDWITGGTAVCGLLAIIGQQGISTHLLPHIGLAVALFGVGFVLYQWNAFGGGDAKWLAAIGLWIGPNLAFARFMIVMSLAGGAVSLIVLLIAKIQSGRGRDPGKPRVPYGAAIALGGMDFWLFQGSVGQMLRGLVSI